MSPAEERSTETYGPIRSTNGQGCSGGGLQQYVVGATYPGLLAGLLPMCSPDIWTTAQEVVDRQLFTDPLGSGCDPKTSALLAMDEWLAAVEDNTSDAPKAQKVIENRPARATDSCWVAGKQ